MVYNGFEPYANSRSRILILGSFPSVKSRIEGFYYGNKQNKFWRILSKACECEIPQTVADKKQLLSGHGIALWDVVTSCEIKGSMDKDITSPVIADIHGFIKAHNIKHIITNGAKAYKLFSAHFPELTAMCIPLPSTSPANARLNPNIWIDTLTALLAE